MKTATAVRDDKLTDEELGRLNRRTGEITRRLNEGTLGYNWVTNQLQRVVEGKNIDKHDWTVWTSLKVGEGKPDLSNIRISRTAQGIFESHAFPWSLTETNLDLVEIGHRYWYELHPSSAPSELSRGELYQCAQELGLRLSPPALVVSLYHFITTADECREMRKTPCWKLNIGMEPVYSPILDKLVVLKIESELAGTSGVEVEIGAAIATMCRYNTSDSWLFVSPPVP